jgi:ParB/RepB/Spo0J family partition protein
MNLRYKDARLAVIATSELSRDEGWDASCLRYRVAPEGLVGSVRQSGVIEPLIVEEWRDGYRIISGFVRAAAARTAGLPAVPAVVFGKDRLSAADALFTALSSNAPGTTLTDVDRAFALAKARAVLGLSDVELARQVAPLLGLPASFKVVRQYIELTSLPRAVLDAVAAGTLSRQHGEAILVVPADAREAFLARAVLGLGLSASETRAFAEGIMDLSVRHKRAFGDMLGEVLAAIVEDGKPLPAAKAKTVARDKLSRMLLPSITAMKDEFNALVAELGLAPGVSVTHSLSFEADEIRISTVIARAEDVSKLADALKDGLARGVFDRLLTISPRMTARLLDAGNRRGG